MPDASASMSTKPLVRWFMRTRLTRAQVLLGGLYVFSIAHMTFRSIRHGDAMSRIHWMATILPLVWPVWVIDDSYRFDGPVRLFLAPRGRHGVIATRYVATRLLFAAIVGATSIVIGLNTHLATVSPRTTALLVAAAVVTCVFIASVATAIVSFVQGKTAILLLYVVLFGVAAWEKSSEGVLAWGLKAVFPLWCLSIGAWQQVAEESVWRAAWPLAAAAGWCALAVWQFRRNYR